MEIRQSLAKLNFTQPVNQCNSTKYTFDERFVSTMHKKPDISIQKNQNGISLALHLKYDLGCKPLLVNVGDSERPGHGWELGCEGIEQNNFRQTNLNCFLNKENYPLEPHECLFSKNVNIIRKSEKELYALFPKPLQLDIVTVSETLNHDIYQRNEPYLCCLKMKLKLIFQVAAQNEHNVVVITDLGFNAGTFSVNCMREIRNECNIHGSFLKRIYFVLQGSIANVLKNVCHK